MKKIELKNNSLLKDIVTLLNLIIVGYSSESYHSGLFCYSGLSYYPKCDFLHRSFRQVGNKAQCLISALS